MNRRWREIPAGEQERIVTEARELAAQGVTWTDMGKRFCVAVDTIRERIDMEFRAKRRPSITCDGVGTLWKMEPRVPPHVLAARLAEIPVDNRSLTARIFGDPVPGRSALARKQSDVTA